ncbi:hypothetical protein L8E42_004910, partial [Klebsiella pneumoniae]
VAASVRPPDEDFYYAFQQCSFPPVRWVPVSENESFLEFSNHGPVFRAHFKKAQLDALSSAPAVLKLP